MAPSSHALVWKESPSALPWGLNPPWLIYSFLFSAPPPAPQSPLLSTPHPQQTPPGPQSSWRAEQAAQDKGQPSRFSSDAEHTIPALSLPAAQLPAQEATKPPSPPPRTGRFHMPRVGRRGSRGGHLMPWAAVRQAQRQETSQQAVWMQEARGRGPSGPRAVKVCERGGWGVGPAGLVSGKAHPPAGWNHCWRF